MADSEAAVAIVRTQGPDEAVLLIRRAERVGDPWSGHWSFPGGRRDPQDHDLLETALRELAEECGIVLTEANLDAELPARPVGRRVGMAMMVAPFVFRVEHELPTALDHREAVEALWTPLRMLRDESRHTLQSVPGMPEEMQFPAMDLNGVPLWGFTYQLVTDWLEIPWKGTHKT
jgi:8-oxo-dGTP pyrophosphatase MutT (NUDIX family)